ncbi:MAG TPA: hypothetical protein PLH11_05915 [Gemmobacter sp.]|nr:hypothetical protein [Gemmobacter sp.]
MTDYLSQSLTFAGQTALTFVTIAGFGDSSLSHFPVKPALPETNAASARARRKTVMAYTVSPRKTA